jgi:hypothetical protein
MYIITYNARSAGIRHCRNDPRININTEREREREREEGREGAGGGRERERERRENYIYTDYDTIICIANYIYCYAIRHLASARATAGAWRGRRNWPVPPAIRS